MNPATLGGISVPCGRITHDRPFGLLDLSSHAFVLATPLPDRLGVGLGLSLGLGLGAARRGSDTLRENAVWIGSGLHLTDHRTRLRLGLASRWLWWHSVTGAGSHARGWRFGAQFAVSDAWSIDGSIQLPTDISPRRVDVRLTRRDQTGAMSGNVSARQGRRHIPAVSLAAFLHPRLILAGEVRSLAQNLSAGGTVRGRIDLHTRIDTHPVLGRSYGGGLTSSCNR